MTNFNSSNSRANTNVQSSLSSTSIDTSSILNQSSANINSLSPDSTFVNIDLSEVNSNLKIIAEKEIDFSKINENLESLITVLTPTNKQLLQQCAISLYSHADFDKKSPIHLAQEAIDRSIVLVSELQNKKLL